MTSSKSPDCGEPRLQKEKQSTSPTWSPRKEAGGQAGRGRTVTFLTFKVSRMASPTSSSVSGPSSACPQPSLTAGTPLSPRACPCVCLSCDTGSSGQQAPCPQLPWCPPAPAEHPEVSLARSSLPPTSCCISWARVRASRCPRVSLGCELWGRGGRRLPGLRTRRRGGAWGGRTGGWVSR